MGLLKLTLACALSIAHGFNAADLSIAAAADDDGIRPNGASEPFQNQWQSPRYRKRHHLEATARADVVTAGEHKVVRVRKTSQQHKKHKKGHKKSQKKTLRKLQDATQEGVADEQASSKVVEEKGDFKSMIRSLKNLKYEHTPPRQEENAKPVVKEEPSYISVMPAGAFDGKKLSRKANKNLIASLTRKINEKSKMPKLNRTKTMISSDTSHQSKWKQDAAAFQERLSKKSRNDDKVNILWNNSVLPSSILEQFYTSERATVKANKLERSNRNEIHEQRNDTAIASSVLERSNRTAIRMNATRLDSAAELLQSADRSQRIDKLNAPAQAVERSNGTEVVDQRNASGPADDFKRLNRNEILQQREDKVTRSVVRRSVSAAILLESAKTRDPYNGVSSTQEHSRLMNLLEQARKKRMTNEPACDAKPFSAAYGKGQFKQLEDDLIHLSNGSGEAAAVEVTEKVRDRIQILRHQYRSMKSNPRNCLWRSEAEGARVVAALNWEWKPESCTLGRNLTFETLPVWLKSRNATLRFFGDSLNDDMAQQLAIRIGSKDPMKPLVTSLRKDDLGAPIIRPSILQLGIQSFFLIKVVSVMHFQ
jgi:hypothetical protein